MQRLRSVEDQLELVASQAKVTVDPTMSDQVAELADRVDPPAGRHRGPPAPQLTGDRIPTRGRAVSRVTSGAGVTDG